MASPRLVLLARATRQVQTRSEIINERSNWNHCEFSHSLRFFPKHDGISIVLKPMHVFICYYDQIVQIVYSILRSSDLKWRVSDIHSCGCPGKFPEKLLDYMTPPTHRPSMLSINNNCRIESLTHSSPNLRSWFVGVSILKASAIKRQRFLLTATFNSVEMLHPVYFMISLQDVLCLLLLCPSYTVPGILFWWGWHHRYIRIRCPPSCG